MAGALVGDEVTGALVGEEVLELLFVLVDFPLELLADLVPTFAEAMERVAWWFEMRWQANRWFYENGFVKWVL